MSGWSLLGNRVNSNIFSLSAASLVPRIHLINTPRKFLCCQTENCALPRELLVAGTASKHISLAGAESGKLRYAVNCTLGKRALLWNLLSHASVSFMECVHSGCFQNHRCAPTRMTKPGEVNTCSEQCFRQHTAILADGPAGSHQSAISSSELCQGVPYENHTEK